MFNIGADTLFFPNQAGLTSSGESTNSSQSRPRPRPVTKDSRPSHHFDAYWDDPEFFRQRIPSNLSRASSHRSIRSSPPLPDLAQGFEHGLDGDVPPRNTVGARLDDGEDEDDVVEMCSVAGGVYSSDSLDLLLKHFHYPR